MKFKFYLVVFALLVTLPLGVYFLGKVDRVEVQESGQTRVQAVEKSNDQNDQVESFSNTPTLAKPSRLIISELGIDAEVEFVGKDENGRMDVPKKDENVAWWKLGAKPGEIGSAVLAGHFDRKDGGPAVFYEIGNLSIGDTVQVLDEEGNTNDFKVTRKETFEDATFPLEEVFATSDGKYLNLITCDGTWDPVSKNYSDRLVIFTELVE